MREIEVLEIRGGGDPRPRLEAVLATPGAGVRVVTRSDRILGSLAILLEIHAAGGASVEIEIASLDRSRARGLEPGAAPPRRRLAAMRRLAQAGIPTGLVVGPVAPGLTDSLGGLRRLVRAGAAAGASTVRARVLRLAPGVREGFLEVLGRERPALAARYRFRYGQGQEPPPDYEERVNRVIDALRQEAGLRPGPPPVSPEPQMRLPFGGLADGIGYAVASGERTAASLILSG